MASESELTLRHVVVALDAAADFAPAIELGGLIAAAWGADLRGLFAEDGRLQRLAALPFAQQIDPLTALRSPVNPTGLRNEVAALAERMRQALKQVADRHGLGWSFETVAASAGRESVVVDEDELLVVGISARPIARQLRLDSPWQSVVGDLRQRLLLVGRPTMSRSSVAVLYDATSTAQRALQAAIRIASISRSRLVIAMPVEAGDIGRAAAEAAARRSGVAATVISLPGLSPPALAGILGGAIDLLVLAGDGMAARDEICDLLRSAPGAVLIV